MERPNGSEERANEELKKKDMAKYYMANTLNKIYMANTLNKEDNKQDVAKAISERASITVVEQDSHMGCFP